MPSYRPENSPRLDNLLSLKGKTALIIGGSGLLGGEITYALAEMGANVIVASRNRNRCEDFVKTLRKKIPNVSANALSVDITEKSSIEILVKAVGDIGGGKLDILVNSGWSGRKNTLDSITDDDWNSDLEVCLSGVFRVIKASIPLLKVCQGNILTIASMYGHVAPDYRMYDSERFANPPSYGAAKAGVIQLTKYLASFLSPYGIRANCISPGPFPFEKTQIENPEFINRLVAKNPLNRIGSPHELKGAAVLLCSDAGSYITGQNFCVDGGWTVW